MKVVKEKRKVRKNWKRKKFKRMQSGGIIKAKMLPGVGGLRFGVALTG